MDFDIAVTRYCESRGGRYYRYSDDILMILPGAELEALDAQQFAIAEVKKHGKKLRIKEKKTAAVVYQAAKGHQTYRVVAGHQGRNGLEYLGFRYDGQEVWIRNSTLSRLYRKISGSIAAECARLVRRYRGKDHAFLAGKFDYYTFFQRYGRVEEFNPLDRDYESWTFWTYARKATKAFGPVGRPIPHQLRRYKLIIRERVNRELAKRLAA